MFPIVFVLLGFWIPFEVTAIKSTEYTGTLKTTIFGEPCQDWRLDTPHRHDYNYLSNNYCRDPTASGYLWCYTKDPKVRWDLCDPRVLTETRPYISILINNTGSACVNKVCCHITWKSFRNVNKQCDPRMFAKLLIFYRLPQNSTDDGMLQFEKKYVTTKYFTFILNVDVRSQLDCAYHCLEMVECNGFIYTKTRSNHCYLGKFNSPDAIKSLSEI